MTSLLYQWGVHWEDCPCNNKHQDDSSLSTSHHIILIHQYDKGAQNIRPVLLNAYKAALDRKLGDAEMKPEQKYKDRGSRRKMYASRNTRQVRVTKAETQKRKRVEKNKKAGKKRVILNFSPDLFVLSETPPLRYREQLSWEVYCNCFSLSNF